MRVSGHSHITCTATILVVILAFLLVIPAPQLARGGVSESPTGPRLMRVWPSSGGTVGRDLTITLSFNRAMDLDSLKEAVSFDPAVDFSVSGEAECLVVPVNLLEGGREYLFRMEPDRAHDLQEDVCAEQVEISFSTRDDAMTIEVPDFSYGGVIAEGEDPQGVANIIGFGVGHYPGTGRPGGGNLVLMAHASGRIPFLFNRLHELAAGDEIRVSYGGRTYIYTWKEGLIVPENAMWITDSQPYPLLSFFVCCAADGEPSPTFHPPYRYVVRAPLSSSVP